MSSGVDRNAQPFSTQTGGQQRKTITKFVEAFEQSGNDVAGLLTHFLESSQVGQKASAEVKVQVRDVLKSASADAERTLDQLVSSMRLLHAAKTTKDREKLRIMSLLAPLFTRADLVRRGFKVSNDAFANARRHAANQGAGAPVGAGGRPRLYTPELAATIDHYCCRPEFSYVNPAFLLAQQTLDPNQQLFSPDEMVEVHDQYGVPTLIPLHAPIYGEGGKEIPNRILRVSVHTLHLRFSEEHPEFKLALQGFRSLLPKNAVKRPRDPEVPLASSLSMSHNPMNGSVQDSVDVVMGGDPLVVSGHMDPSGEMDDLEDHEAKPRKRGRPGKGPTQPSMTVSHQGLAVSAPAPPSALQHQMHPHSHQHMVTHTLSHPHEVMSDHHDGGAAQTMNPLEMDLHGHHAHHVHAHTHGHPHPHETLHMAGHEMQLAHHMHPEDTYDTDAGSRPPTRKRPKIAKK